MIKTILPFRLEEDAETALTTAFAGMPLIVELWQRFGLDARIAQHVRLREMGYGAKRMLTALIFLQIAGGEHLTDIEIINSDAAVRLLVGQDFTPCDQTAGRYLRDFHVTGKRLENVDAWVPKEGKHLMGLNRVNQDFVRDLIKRSGLTTVTIENDATPIFCQKDGVYPTYKGGKGYMPTIGSIAELGLVIADEFRDGNVPPAYDVLSFFIKCKGALPDTVKTIRVRFDGAYYQHDLILHLNSFGIKFTITAKKSHSFMLWVYALPESAWQPLLAEDGTDTGKDYAEMPWTSAMGSAEEMKARVLRYLLTREREPKKLDDPKDRYEAIATSFTEKADELIRWHYKRGGAIEHIHDGVKNDLAGKKLPCSEFGANAAWWRLNIIAFNLVRALQILALPAPFHNCHLKKLRLWLLNIAGRVIRSGREVILKIAHGHPAFEDYKNAREKIAALEFP